MAVSEKDVVDGDNLVGGLTDVEANVELGYSNDGLLTGDGIADDVEVVNFYMCQIVAWHRAILKTEIVDGGDVSVNCFCRALRERGKICYTLVTTEGMSEKK